MSTVKNEYLTAICNYAVMFEVVEALVINMALFSDVTPYNMVYVLYQLSSENLGPIYVGRSSSKVS